MTGNTAVFTDGQEVEIDSFVYCTGFVYDFPFLTPDIVDVTNQRVTPLYKHMFHTFYNNLIFIGIPSTFSYFPQVHEQSKAAASFLNDDVQLPVPTEMLMEEERDYQYRLNLGLGTHQAHFMGVSDMQFKYNSDLAKQFGFQPFPKVMHKILADVSHHRSYDFANFRSRQYRILD